MYELATWRRITSSRGQTSTTHKSENKMKRKKMISEQVRMSQNKIYKTASRPAMTYGGECWAIRKCEQNQMNTTKMKMLSCIQGKTRTDQKCYHPRKGTHNANKYFPEEEATVMVQSCAAER